MRERPANVRWTVLVAVGLLAGAVMLFEIALTRIFSFTIWHHFAFMVLSVALLGFAVSGVVLARWPSLARLPARHAAWCAAGFAVAMILAVRLVTHVPFDPTQLAVQRLQLFYLALSYAVLVVPFGLAGLGVVTLLNGFAASVGRVYASDLAGAGLGCVMVVGLMRWLGADGVVWAAATAAAVAAALLGYEPGRRATLGWLVLPVLLLVTLPMAAPLLSIPPGAGKALTTFLDRQRFPEARLAHTEWNAISRIDVVEGSGTVRWTANPQSNIPLPPQVQIVIDGDAATPIVASDGDLAGLTFLDYMLPSAGLQAFRPARVLIIGAGGGVDVLGALRHGADHVEAVELNAAIVDLVTDRYAPWSGQLFARPDVRLHVAEGRAFVRQTPDRFDAIQLSLVDTWAASAAGAYSLSEAYLYTVEAFVDYLTRLTDDGVLTFTRWLWSPPRETLRLCTVAVAALRRLGVTQPENHLVVMFMGRLGTVLIKRSPFADTELAALQRVAAARQFGFLYAPGGEGDNEFVSFLRAADAEAWIDAYPYDVRPPTDDRPFFFQFGRWRSANPFGAGWGESMLALSGRLVLLATSIQALILSALLLIAPLALRRRQKPRRIGGVAVYFFAIGLSFMLLEVSLMQRFTLFLGHPVYAIACVLAVLLLAAALGSALSERLGSGERGPRLVCAAIAALSIAYTAVLPPVFRLALGYPLPARIAVAIALLAPLGILLGVPFPAAVASIRRRHADASIGWAWAANGCASVLAPLLAVLIAMDFGFSTVEWVAALGYGVALTAFGRWGAAEAAAE